MTKGANPSNAFEHIVIFYIHPLCRMVFATLTKWAFTLTFHFCSSIARWRSTLMIAIASLTSRSNALTLRFRV